MKPSWIEWNGMGNKGILYTYIVQYEKSDHELQIYFYQLIIK